MAINEKGYTPTPEEVKVGELLEIASERIKEIDARINNPDKYIPRTPRPSWMGPSQPTGVEKDHFKKTQEYYRKDLKEQTRNEAAKLVEKSPTTVQVRAFAVVDDWSNNHTTEKEKFEELQNSGKKDLSKSQDAAMRLLKDEKPEVFNKNSYTPSYLKQPGEDDPSGSGGGGGTNDKTPEIEPEPDI